MLLDPNNKYHYDIITAMRGPDDNGSLSKDLYTSVVRNAVMKRTDTYQVPNDIFVATVHGALLNTMENARVLLAKPSTRVVVEPHYMWHQRAAFIALNHQFPHDGYRDYFNDTLKVVKVKGYDHLHDFFIH